MKNAWSKFNGAAGLVLLCCLASALLVCWAASPSWGGLPVPSVITVRPLQPLQTMALGKALFSDVNLSNPPGQSCASCHGADAGFKFPLKKINVQSGIPPGAVKGRFENRIPPTISYAAYLPPGPPQFTSTVEAFTGGLFWDGHATSLTDQVTHPFQNPNEMNDLLHNVGDPALVVQKLQMDGNAFLFRQVYGDQVFSQSATAVFNLIAQAIAAYETSPEVSPFSSKYDQYTHGLADLSDNEMRGLRLVTGSKSGRPGGPAYYKNARCVDCHGIPADPTVGPDLWTNSCYDNIGVPRNAANPFYNQTNPITNPVGFNAAGSAYVDLGLGGFFIPFSIQTSAGQHRPG